MVFILMLTVLVVAMILANSVFLERFYESRLARVLVRAFDLVDSHITRQMGADEDYFSEDFASVQQTNNLLLVVTDSEFRVIVGEGERGEGIMSTRLFGYSAGIDNDASVLKSTADYKIQKKKDDRLKSEYLELWGTLPASGYYCIMRIPMESIHVNAQISTEFVLYIAILALIIGVIMIQFLSQRIAQPILELTRLSERMANLDFNAKYLSGGKNEIGQLGEHFNKMSETLEKTISELKTANNELQQNLDEKIRIDDERREFLSNVSHELKTPLALIQGYAEGLRDCVNDDEESRDYYCEVIMDEANKMNTLVRKLLTLNQLETGYDKIEMVRFDLADLIRGKVASSMLLAEQKNAKISLKCPEKVHVWGDEFKVEEVLTNYLSNAINHVDGALEIRILVEDNRETHKVRTTVFNTGSRIPEEDLDLVWDKFFKVDKARTRAYGGSGVGLSIVRAIMESFHQAYGVRNEEDGVSFWFELESGDGELIDEEIDNEEKYRRQNGASLEEKIFSRTEQARTEKELARAEAAARRAAEEKVVDASWVPVEENKFILNLGGRKKAEKPKNSESPENPESPEKTESLEKPDCDLSVHPAEAGERPDSDKEPDA